MGRRASRVDANQPDIVKALRAAGVSVAHTHMIGHGFPDILAGLCGVNILMEIKDGDKPPSARKLTPDEATWHAAWDGQVVVVSSPEEALAALGLTVRGVVS